MNIYKTPTPEEINEAALKAGVDKAAEHASKLYNDDQHEHEDFYTVGQHYYEGWKDAISWLQNYQTQQHGAVKSAEEIVNQMCSEMPYLLNGSIRPYIYEAMEIYASQFQTPASVGSVEQAASEHLENDAKSLLGRSSLRNDEPGKTIYVLGAKFGANWQLRQSSQPQPNAISVIEERIKELREMSDHHDQYNNFDRIEELTDLLTKLKKQQ